MLLASAVRRRAAAHLRGADPVMATIVRKVGPCRMSLHRQGTNYWYLTRAILRQQISGHAAAAIEKRISERFAGTPQPADILAATDAELRALGLSRQKASYLRDLSAKASDGLPLGRLAGMSEERLVETVTAVKGIGRWTAEMLMMFRQGRPDILPTGDYGIQKAMQVAYRMRALPKPARMHQIAEPWRPYRTVACWYLWRSLDQKP